MSKIMRHFNSTDEMLKFIRSERDSNNTKFEPKEIIEEKHKTKKPNKKVKDSE